MSKKFSYETVFGFEFPSQAISFDAEAFDELIHSQGVEMVHFRSMRCPVGMIDPDDMRRPHEHHENCSNNFIYTKAGEVTCAFLGNSGDTRFMDAGRLDGSTVNVVMPRFYDDCPAARIDLTQFDRLYLKEESITVTTWETFATHITGRDRLNFPAITVIDFVDANGVRYKQDVDFEVKQGQLVWGSTRPGVDPKTGKGRVCSIRYTYRPHWYVKNLIHEVRVAQIEDFEGNRGVERMPQAATLQREYFFQKAQADELAKDPEGRQKPGDTDGGFGPR